MSFETKPLIAAKGKTKEVKNAITEIGIYEYILISPVTSWLYLILDKSIK